MFGKNKAGKNSKNKKNLNSNVEAASDMSSCGKRNSGTKNSGK